MNAPTGDGGPTLRVHALLQQAAPAYLQRFGATMPLRQRQVLHQILRCRTPALGGELFACTTCPGRYAYRYHSCNDRHCPQCGQTDTDAWLQRQQARLLFPVPYFLVTFTVPEPLRAWIRSQLQLGLDLLFATSAQALQDLARNPTRLGAQLGMLGVLHTWSRTLIFHPHIHYLVPGGGLSPDQRQWVPAQKFLLHHTPLGEHFRTLFQERLRKEHPELFAQVPAKVWQDRWNVGCQAAGSGENALRYLSRYIFKTATANRSLPVLPDGKLVWSYRESKTRRFTSIRLEPFEFLRRFLQHVLPRGFARVRTFGWLHPAAKVRANRVRALLRQAPVLSTAQHQAWQLPTGLSAPPPPATDPPPAPAPLCPGCHRPMLAHARWHAGQQPPRPPLPLRPRPP